MSLGEGHDLVPGVVARHRRTDDKGGTRAGAQRLGHLGERLRVSAYDRAKPARLDRVAAPVPVVDRN